MWTDSGRDDILGLLDTKFAGLIKSVTDWRAGTVVEADYTGYGTRPAITFGAAGNTTPTGGRQRSNSAPVTFPQNTGSNQDVIGWGWWTAATGGTLKGIGLLDADAPILGTGDDTSEVITAPAHGLSNDQQVIVLAAPGAVIPTGLAENTEYFVVNVTTDTFQLSATQGGAAVNITAKGAALFIPFSPVTIAGLATPSFAAGTLIEQV